MRLWLVWENPGCWLRRYDDDPMVNSSEKRVMVSGCFDLLHSGHVAFLSEAATHGKVTVCLGSDKTVFDLKGRRPVNDERERSYMLRALACVDKVIVSRGSGHLDFEPEIQAVQPDVFFVNQDGDSQAKRELIESRGIRYVVASRVPETGLNARSTTDLRGVEVVPYRLDLAGGWLDQPFVSQLHPGSVITISLEPNAEFQRRSGMASSTRESAKALWGPRLPIDDRVKLAKLLFAWDNLPGTKDIAGSQDAIGIVFPGLNRLDYDGEYWPSHIESVHDDSILDFLESHLYLKHIRARPGEFEVLAEQNLTVAGARELADAAAETWDAILSKDAAKTGRAIQRSYEAQVAMFPLMSNEDVKAAIAAHQSACLGYKLSGAGGGGYLVMFSEQTIEGSVRPRIRREI